MAEIIRRGNGYLIRVSEGYSPSGKHCRKSMTWIPPAGMKPEKAAKEASIQAALFEERVRSGHVADGTMKFEVFAERFMRDHADKNLAIKTVFGYRDMLPRINQAIGHLRMGKIRPGHLIDFYSNLAETGIRSDTRYNSTKLAGHLKKTKLSASEVAIRAEIGATTVLNACCGKNVSEATAKAISKALNVKMTSLFTPINSEAKLSSNTINHYHRLISSIFSKAVAWQVITDNPARRVEPPKIERKEAAHYNDVEAKEIVLKLQDEPLQKQTMIILKLYTGLRRGELCGLKWSDIDFSKKLLHVLRKIQYLPKLGIFEGPPKNNKTRVIKLSGAAIRLLLTWRNAQCKEIEACGDQWHDNDLLFTKWNGNYCDPDELTGWFNSFTQRKSLKRVNLHGLRHTNATLMIAAGTDLPTVSKRLGHAQISTTSNIYVHAIRSADEAAAETIENVLAPDQPGQKVFRFSTRNRRLTGNLKAVAHK